MKITFQLTLDDFLAAQHLHATRDSLRKFFYVLKNFIYPIIGLIFLLFAILISRTDGYSGGDSMLLIASGIFLALFPLYVRLLWKRCYKRTRSGNGDCNVLFNQDGLLIDGQFSKGEMSWKAFKSYLESAKVFNLYLAPGKFLVIPKRVLAPESIEELRALLLEQIGSTNL